MAEKKSFYVMIEREGEEILLSHHASERAAIAAAHAELARAPYAVLSVWTSTGGIRYLLDKERGLVKVRARAKNPRRRPARRRRRGRAPVHTAKYDRCVRDVRRKGTAVNPFAVCSAALGERGILKRHRRRAVNPRRSRRLRRASLEYVIHARRGNEHLAYHGDRFIALRKSGARAHQVKFPTRALAVKFARHLKRTFGRRLKGWSLRVERA